MTNFIPYSGLKLINFLILILCVSCNESKTLNPFKSYQKAEITLPEGQKLNVYLAISPEQQTLGLSHVQPNEFSNNDTMLFTADHFKVRQFWMPETYFNLDIIFLGPDLEVLDLQRNVPFYTKRTPKEKVPLSKLAYCQHVLEIKSESPLASQIKEGLKLNWSSSPNLSQIISNTHPEQ